MRRPKPITITLTLELDSDLVRFVPEMIPLTPPVFDVVRSRILLALWLEAIGAGPRRKDVA